MIRETISFVSMLCQRELVSEALDLLMLRCDVATQSINSILLSLDDRLHRGSSRIERLDSRSQEIVIRNQVFNIDNFLFIIADDLDQLRVSFNSTCQRSGESVIRGRSLGDELRIGDWRFEDVFGSFLERDSVERGG